MTITSSGILLNDSAQFVLQHSRDELSTGYRDLSTEAEVTRILDGAAQIPSDESSALRDLTAVLDGLRTRPRGPGRLAGMNSFVRTLGQRDNFALFLELLRGSLSTDDPDEGRVAKLSQGGRMHCIYGWAGQTLVLASNDDPTPATVRPPLEIEKRFGYPIARWHISIHVWQPNPNAKGFSRTKRIEPGIIGEPPHSHPYDFVSYVATGSMRQSIYAEDIDVTSADDQEGRYHGVVLERVDGVWPPHESYESRELTTLEHRVELTEGQSYYMASDAIHDVEIERDVAGETPTITVMLASETTDIAKAYFEPEMAEFHRLNPDVKDGAAPLDPDEWRAMMTATAQYLRRETPYLRLGEIFECNSTYGFMHV